MADRDSYKQIIDDDAASIYAAFGGAAKVWAGKRRAAVMRDNVGSLAVKVQCGDSFHELISAPDGTLKLKRTSGTASLQTVVVVSNIGKVERTSQTYYHGVGLVGSPIRQPVSPLALAPLREDIEGIADAVIPLARPHVDPSLKAPEGTRDRALWLIRQQLG